MISGYFKTMLIMFIGIAVGPVLMLGVVIFLQAGSSSHGINYDHPLIYYSVAISTICVLGSVLIPRLWLPSIRQNEIRVKLEKYRALFIMRIAMVELASLFNIVCLLLLEYDLFLYLAVALIALQFMNLPTRNKIQTELNLSVEETASL